MATSSSSPDPDVDGRARGQDPASEDRLRAADGRLPGRRGRQTRERLLDATATMLQERSYRDLAVVDVTRRAGTSPATFYQYFADVEAAVLVLAERMLEDGDRLRATVADASWTGRGARTSAEALVDQFMAFWQAHGAVLRVVDLAIAEGDRRFRSIRTRLLAPVAGGLRDVAAELDRTGHDPLAAGAVLMSMLAHVAEHQELLVAWDVDVPSVRETLVAVVHWVLTGRRPPAS